MADPVREPKATVQIPGIESSGLSGVSLTMNVGQPPQAEVSYHPTDKPVVRIMSGELATKMGEMQGLGFSNRTAPDTTITIEDGKETLTFKGLVTGPAMSSAVGVVERSARVIHEVALLDTLNAGIYQYDHGDMFSSDSLASGDSWSARLQAATDFLVKTGVDRFPDFSGADRELIAQQHQLNESLGLPIWKDILSASNEFTASEALKKLAGGTPQSLVINNGIGNAILSTLMGSSNRFWQTLDYLCSMFQLVYVPNFERGYLITMREMVAGSPVDMPVGAVDVRMDGSSPDLLPIQQVLLRSACLRTWPQEPEDKPQIIAGWPEAAGSTGQVMEQAMPHWLVPYDTLGPTGRPTSVASAAPGINDPVDIQSYRSGSNTILRRARKALNEAVQELLTEYARNMWVDRSLAASTVNFTVPMSTKWLPGKRYRITSPDDGSTLFTAFLAGVTHSMSLTSGQGSMPSSSLRFTHAQLGSFELPNL